MDANLSIKKGGDPGERPRRSQEPGVIAIKSVGIVGAGQMGNGIAHVAAVAGYDVALNDLKKEAVDKAEGELRRELSVVLARMRAEQEALSAAKSAPAPKPPAPDDKHSQGASR